MRGTHKNDEVINALLEKFNIDRDNDVYEKVVGNKLHYRIITRKGIDKIEALSKAKVSFDVIKCERDHVVLKFTAIKGDETIETTGEADEDNVRMVPKYLSAMAEARGRARAILKIEGFYKLGFNSEDEADDFQDIVRGKSSGSKPFAKAKGAGAEEFNAADLPNF